MPRRMKSWWRPGKHYGRPPEPSPSPSPPEPEPEPELEPTVATKVIDVAKAAVTAPVKGAAVVGSAAVGATVAAVSLPAKAGRAMKKAIMARPKQEVSNEDVEEIVEEAEKEINKVDEALMPTKRGKNGRFKRPKNPLKKAPPETLEPPMEPKIAGGILSGYECNFCGKTYRLERYFLPHLEKCLLNPDNVGRA